MIVFFLQSKTQEIIYILFLSYILFISVQNPKKE